VYGEKTHLSHFVNDKGQRGMCNRGVPDLADRLRESLMWMGVSMPNAGVGPAPKTPLRKQSDMSSDLLLSEAESEALISLDCKLMLIDDRVTAVVRGYQTGFYLCGAGGLGKSYSVYRRLQELECDFRAFNSRMTALGLFRALDKAPEAVHVL